MWSRFGHQKRGIVGDFVANMELPTPSDTQRDPASWASFLPVGPDPGLTGRCLGCSLPLLLGSHGGEGTSSILGGGEGAGLLGGLCLGAPSEVASSAQRRWHRLSIWRHEMGLARPQPSRPKPTLLLCGDPGGEGLTQRPRSKSKRAFPHSALHASAAGGGCSTYAPVAS